MLFRHQKVNGICLHRAEDSIFRSMQAWLQETSTSLAEFCSDQRGIGRNLMVRMIPVHLGYITSLFEGDILTLIPCLTRFSGSKQNVVDFWQEVPWHCFRFGCILAP